jgi:hypothetical protein
MQCPDCHESLELYSMEFIFLSDEIVEPLERFQCANCNVHWIMRDGALTKVLEVKAT